jgi:hypothetical protein
MGKEKSKELFVVGTSKFFGSVIRKEQSYFDFDQMYTAWKDWFDDHKYMLNEKGQTEGRSGPYMDKKIEWVAFRNVTSYVRFCIDIFLWVRRMRQVTIEHKGEKMKVWKGDLYIGFKGYLKKDYGGRWKNYEFLRQMMDRYILKWQLSGYEGKIWAEANDLIAVSKKHVGMMPLKKE